LFKLLDAKDKMPAGEVVGKLAAYGFTPEQAEIFQKGIIRISVEDVPPGGGGTGTSGGTGNGSGEILDMTFFSQAVTPLAKELVTAGIIDWIDFDLSVVRGLAYYTGMVFEVHEAGGGERAIAGGGRYDKLIEMFGGPPTPAVGFGMGDVVLSLVLQDKGLMPTDAELLERVGARPDVFVISNGQPAADAQVRPLVAGLREAGLHARHTYKTTKNVGKLLQEAAGCGAKFAVIVESDTGATVKAMGSGEQREIALSALVAEMAKAKGR
jgi:histidyl-tRNA synthetase